MIKITLCMWLVRPWHKVTFLHKTKQTRWSDYSVKLRPKRMCCQRPRGNIQRVQLAIPASATSLHSFFGDALLGPGWIRSERRIGVIPTSHRHSFCEKKFLSREGARHKHQRICGRTEHISSSGLEASHNSLFMLHLDACVGVIKAGSIFSFFGSTFLKHSSSSLAWSAFQVGQEKTSSPYCLFTCIVHQSNESVTSVDCENNQSIYIYIQVLDSWCVVSLVKIHIPLPQIITPRTADYMKRCWLVGCFQHRQNMLVCSRGWWLWKIRVAG